MDPKYTPEKCPHCGQSTTYVLPIDRGTVDIMKAFATAIRLKGINTIHPRREMEVSGARVDYRKMVAEGKLTSNQVGNLSRPRFHGLIAKIKGNPGNYCLTTKGGRFLRGLPVHKYAIVSKSKSKQIGYWMPDIRVVIDDFRPGDGECWEGINFNIVSGRIVSGPVEDAPFEETDIALPGVVDQKIYRVDGKEIYRVINGKIVYPDGQK